MTHSSEIIIKEDVLISWDRGWDTEEEQVLGPEFGGYIFRKVAPKPPPPITTPAGSRL